MTLIQAKAGDKFKITNIAQKKLNQQLLGLGVCKGDACYIQNAANGNILVKTMETKIVISDKLAKSIEIEVIK